MTPMKFIVNLDNSIFFDKDSKKFILTDFFIDGFLILIEMIKLFVNFKILRNKIID